MHNFFIIAPAPVDFPASERFRRAWQSASIMGEYFHPFCIFHHPFKLIRKWDQLFIP